MAAGTPNAHASSTGQTMTGAGWLDAHFEANRPEYEAQVRAVGIQPGWRVLDAGCGAGNFLPWLADLVGPGGSIAALDLAPDNIAVVEARLADWRLPTPVEARVGSVTALPYADDAFDALWCANTSQYLTDDELATALAEMRRVVRPGGLVAIKDTDPAVTHMLPAPPALELRNRAAAARAGNVQMQGVMRATNLPAWLRRAGLTDVRRRTTLIERGTPGDPAVRQMLRDFYAFYAARAQTLDLSAEDQAYWARLREPGEVERLLDHPDFYSCEGNILAVGRVPGEAAPGGF